MRFLPAGIVRSFPKLNITQKQLPLAQMNQRELFCVKKLIL